MDVPSFPTVDLFAAVVSGLIAVLVAFVFRVVAVRRHWEDVVPGLAESSGPIVVTGVATTDAHVDDKPR